LGQALEQGSIEVLLPESRDKPDVGVKATGALVRCLSRGGGELSLCGFDRFSELSDDVLSGEHHFLEERAARV
jgi:hypothetical protein